ncbi:hypothetical protein RBH26_20550, partial [Natronolimnohabitans sp. A-GB9]|uniref:hypothetical protein n=1 Tax=Natronolimnohabitans sp. A-GB9 TaxID=3069757 RepID=UPI0027B7B2AB
MPDLLLYTLVVPQASQSELPTQLQQQLASAGIIGEDGGVVEQIASNPADQTVIGVYRSPVAEKMAIELEELATASGFGEVPLTGLNETTPVDGYYAIEEVDVAPPQPRTDRVQQFELQLTKEGTRNSHWRAIETNPRQADHDWGNDLEASLAVPAAASKVQWFNPDNHSRTVAQHIEVRSAELGGVAIYDLDAGQDAVGTDTPMLIYEIPYRAEENVDCRVYDTRDRVEKTDDNGVLQWQKIFSTIHDFDAPIVLDNGVIRLRLDEAEGTLEAERWDPDRFPNETGLYGAGLYGEGIYYGAEAEWFSVDLEQPDDVTLFDVDLVEIGMVRDRVQLTFSVADNLFSL